LNAIHTLRWFNFGYFSLFALFLSFLPVYLSSRGISETGIGLMMGAGGIVGLVAQPLWGVVSDRRRTIKKVLLFLLALSVVVGVATFQLSTLWALAIGVGLMYFLFMPTDPLMESLNFQVAQKHGVPYGSVRMFGAIGYATASFAVGMATDAFGLGAMGVLFAGYGLATILIAARAEDAPAASKPLRWAELQGFLSRRESLVFFLLVLLVAVPHRTNDLFVGIHITALGGDYRTVGMTWFVMTIAEVAFFGLAHRFLKPGRELTVIALAAVLYVLRFALTSAAAQPFAVVLLQLLQGVTFVLFYTASIQYLYRIVPEPWRATGQTILAVLFFGVSGIVASFLGGWVFDAFGGETLYRGMAALSAIGAAYCFAVRGRKAAGAAE